MRHLRWVRGGEATVLSLEPDAITLESTTPSPPGSRIYAVLLVGSGASLRLKVHASRRDSTGLFRLEGRPIDMTREVREELAAILAGGASKASSPPPHTGA